MKEIFRKQLGIIKRQAQYRLAIWDIDQKKKKDRQITIGVFTNCAETWNSFKSLTQYADTLDYIHIIVFLFPQRDLNGEIDVVSYHKLFVFFNAQCIETITVFDDYRKKWLDIKQYHLDYIFYDKPYLQLYKPYDITTMFKYSKICYIPYGYSVSHSEPMQKYALPIDFFSYLYAFFPEDNYEKDYVQKNIRCFKFKHHHNVLIGYPRFDLQVTGTNTHEPFCVMWIPRGSAPNFSMKDPTSHTSFFLYWKRIFDRANIKEQWLIRPHPSAFRVFKSSGILSDKEINEYINLVDSNPYINIDYEKDYLISFKKANVLVADFSSIIIEYILTGNPIVYCGDTNAIGIDGLKDCLYFAKCWGELVEIIDQIKRGYDPLKSIRNEFIKVLQGNRDTGEKIIKFLIEDFRK